jgi:hypothetical protein
LKTRSAIVAADVTEADPLRKSNLVLCLLTSAATFSKSCQGYGAVFWKLVPRALSIPDGLRISRAAPRSAS